MTTINGCRRILTINSGSSSIKFTLYQCGEREQLLQSGKLERIGIGEGLFHVEDKDGETLVKREPFLPDHDAALKLLLEWLNDKDPPHDFNAVGHRIVHGGDRYLEPRLLDPDLISALKILIPMAPDHLPHEIKAADAVSRLRPNTPQVACFDTSFHRHMPPPARTYALPRNLREEGVRRYGFHGLSYEYIVEELRKEASVRAAGGRLVIAHLGNGASMAAVYHGKSIDTTMGFTPSGGLVMSTRPGDIDPGLILYLLISKGLPAETLSRLVNEQAGLLGISGISPDMRDLLEIEADRPEAAEAVALFCYQAKKFLASLAAAMGGLDTLVFTGGIGENAPAIRRRICEGLSFMGIHINPRGNDSNAPVISEAGSPVTVRVMKTNEELMIVRHTCRLLDKRQG